MKPARIATIVLRVALGVTFVYAAYLKLRDPWELFAMAVDAYNVLPQWAVVAVARTLPAAEMLIGLFLIAGVFLRTAASAAAALLAGFFTLMVRAYLLHMKIDCGCFGSGDPISMHTLLRDGALLAAALGLAALAFHQRRGGRDARAAAEAAPEQQPLLRT